MRRTRYFACSPIQVLQPRQRIVVVEDVQAFKMRYGNKVMIAGQWSGGQSNAAEQITLMSGNQLGQQFTYQDQWQPNTDRYGCSLEKLNTADDENW